MSQASVRVWIVNAVLLALTGLLYFHVVVPIPAPALNVNIPWWGLAVLFFASEVAVVRLQFREGSLGLSLNELALVAGLYFASPASLILAQLVGGGLAFIYPRRMGRLKFAFNFAEVGLQATVAVVVFHLITGDRPTLGPLSWVAALVAIALVDSMGALLVQVVVTITEGRPPANKIAQAMGLATAGGVTSASLGLLGVTVIGDNPVGAWLLLIPTVTLYIAYRAYVSERERYESIELLYEANRILQRSPSLDVAIMDLLRHVRTMFRAEMAEIVLLAGSGEGKAIRSRVGPADEVETLVESEVEPVQQALAALPPEARGTVRLSLRTDGGIPARLQTHGVRDAIITELEGERRVIGTIMVANRRGDQSTFSEQDRRLFETLAAQAGFSLENGRLEQTLAGMQVENAELERQVLHDPLTRLANRVLFIDRVHNGLSQRPEPGADIGVMFIDLDDFKTVNDTLGHAAGDELLVQVAERLRQSVRPGDTVARLGGDEFGVHMAGIGVETEATNVAKRILDSFNSPFVVNGQEVWSHATIGIATAVPGQIEVPDLLRRADVAMYTAKGEGKSRYAVFSERSRLGIVKSRPRRANP
ncbi:MAG: hypothetical protein NVS9B1_14620 [Candidatus Dormibacteraceae bacterium]